MIQFANRLHREMEQQLELVALKEDRESLKARKSFEVVNQTLHQLKDFIKTYQFTSSAEEIHFFKDLKPRFHHLMIYYGEKTFIESNKPHGDRDTVVKYLRGIVKEHSKFIKRHKIIHSYYQLGRTQEDELMFLRNAVSTSIYPEYNIDLDTTFCTKSSTILSKLMAFEKINDELAGEIEHLKNGVQTLLNPEIKKSTLVWTDSKAALVELAYALLARGSANYGKAELSQIMSTLEIAFNIQTGNYYRTYVDLSSRKKGRTPFIDSLKEHLERRMDQNL